LPAGVPLAERQHPKPNSHLQVAVSIYQAYKLSPRFPAGSEPQDACPTKADFSEMAVPGRIRFPSWRPERNLPPVMIR